MLVRFRNLFRRKRLDRELDAELRYITSSRSRLSIAREGSQPKTRVGLILEHCRR